mmetsp:Transcript_44976/g.118821  ORF Transcript_44976/g.118821 Transcript_44976/m.118821 type:complete len:218 (-) Transcript_44976:1990-2643(-)
MLRIRSYSSGTSLRYSTARAPASFLAAPFHRVGPPNTSSRMRASSLGGLRSEVSPASVVAWMRTRNRCGTPEVRGRLRVTSSGKSSAYVGAMCSTASNLWPTASLSLCRKTVKVTNGDPPSATGPGKVIFTEEPTSTTAGRPQTEGRTRGTVKGSAGSLSGPSPFEFTAVTANSYARPGSRSDTVSTPGGAAGRPRPAWEAPRRTTPIATGGPPPTS